LISQPTTGNSSWRIRLGQRKLFVAYGCLDRGTHLVTPKGEAEKVAYGDARFSKNGKGIYATTDRDSEFNV